MSEMLLVTAEELERMPNTDEYRYELVEGRLIRMTPVTFDHGRIARQGRPGNRNSLRDRDEDREGV